MDDKNEGENNNSTWWTDLPRTQFTRYLWPYPFHRPHNIPYHPMISGILGIEIEVITPHDEHLILQDIHFCNHTIMYRNNNHWYTKERRGVRSRRRWWKCSCRSTCRPASTGAEQVLSGGGGPRRRGHSSEEGWRRRAHREAQQQARLPHARVADEQHLEDVVVLGAHGRVRSMKSKLRARPVLYLGTPPSSRTQPLGECGAWTTLLFLLG